MPKLRSHLLSRILGGDSLSGDQDAQLIIKGDQIYSHNLIRINYTMYDVRRDQDVINAASSHCNVMVISHDGSDSARYRYARVLGTYHVNVIFVGPGMVDSNPIRMEFLWLRWYEQLDVAGTGWVAQKLDRLRFPPMVNTDSFGFLDPADVM